MTSQERKTLKHKMKIQYWIAYTLGIGGTAIYLILIFSSVLPLETEGMNNTDYVLKMFMFISPIIGLPFFALITGMSAGFKGRALSNEFGRMYNIKNKHKFRMFYELITQGDRLDEARAMFNQIALRDDSYRVFAHGMLITVMRMSGVKKNVQMVEKRMSDILEDK